MILRCKVVNTLKISKLGLAKCNFLCYKHRHEMRDTTKERMNDNNQSILSGKYEIIRTLGSGSYSTVYLARHHVLELEQAIKVIPKATADQLSVLSEARLLKSIHHPGIPMIYDIEEDDDSFYLIEEYIRGDSLDTFLLNQPIISGNLFFSFSRQLCEIFIYLHTFMPIPILYQDLKPEHIIVCGDRLKLIDFGVTGYSVHPEKRIRHFGNAQFSAPENFSGADLSTAADVYSLGKLMQLLSKYVDPSLPRNISKIIQKSIHPDPAFRYETVEMLLSALEKEFLNIRSQHLVSNIAVIGSHPGCGCTHIAISLVSALNLLAQNCFYIERSSPGSLYKLSLAYPNMREKDGCFYLRCFKGYPMYGAGITISYPSGAIRVTDYGTASADPAIEQADLILFVCDGAPWRRKDVIEQNNFLHTHKDTVKVIVNHGEKRAASALAKALGVSVYPFFPDTDAFGITRKKRDFFRTLLDQKGQHTLCTAIRRLRLLLHGR